MSYSYIHLAYFDIETLRRWHCGDMRIPAWTEASEENDPARQLSTPRDRYRDEWFLNHTWSITQKSLNSIKIAHTYRQLSLNWHLIVFQDKQLPRVRCLFGRRWSQVVDNDVLDPVSPCVKLAKPRSNYFDPERWAVGIFQLKATWGRSAVTLPCISLQRPKMSVNDCVLGYLDLEGKECEHLRDNIVLNRYFSLLQIIPMTPLLFLEFREGDYFYL